MNRYRHPPLHHMLIWASAIGVWLLMWLPILWTTPLTRFQWVSIFLGIVGAWYGGYVAGFMKGFLLGGRAFQRYLVDHWSDHVAAAFHREAKQQQATKPEAN